MLLGGTQGFLREERIRDPPLLYVLLSDVNLSEEEACDLPFLLLLTYHEKSHLSHIPNPPEAEGKSHTISVDRGKFLVHSPTYTFTHVQNGTHTKPINHSMFVIAKVWNNLTVSQQSAS